VAVQNQPQLPIRRRLTTPLDRSFSPWRCAALAGTMFACQHLRHLRHSPSLRAAGRTDRTEQPQRDYTMIAEPACGTSRSHRLSLWLPHRLEAIAFSSKTLQAACPRRKNSAPHAQFRRLWSHEYSTARARSRIIRDIQKSRVAQFCL
jgi:hypothetical protein